MTMMNDTEKDERRWDTAMTRKQQEGGELNERDKRLEVTCSKRHGDSPASRSTRGWRSRIWDDGVADDSMVLRG